MGGDQPALFFFFFFNICLSITFSAYLTLSLPSFCFFFFSLSPYCRNVSLVAMSNTLLISPCHSVPGSLCFFSLYVSFCLSPFFSLPPSLSFSHPHDSPLRLQTAFEDWGPTLQLIRAESMLGAGGGWAVALFQAPR